MTTRQLPLGPLTVLYENGFLRYLRLGEREVIRMLYFALRDQNWSTLEPTITDEHIEETPDGFSIRYVCHHSVGNQPVFRWQVQITGHTAGELTFAIQGEALARFSRNRAGFCVLHPIRETVGQPVTLVHPDGTQTEAVFPPFISPHQPFLDIQQMRWPVQPGVWAELTFAGDVFETEDQRNWTDASFKTYCTPLSIPFPVTLHPGDRVDQLITLRLSGIEALPVQPTDSEPIRITVDESAVTPFPKIGTGHAAGQPLPTDAEAARLRELAFDHLRLDLNLTKPDWQNTLHNGFAEAQRLHLPIELALTFGPDPEADWQAFLQNPTHSFNQSITQSVNHSFNLFSAHHRATPDTLLDQLLPHVRQTFPNARIGAGSPIHFTDLNRNRFDARQVDFVVYAINPQIHAFDDRTLVENIAAQADTVVSARQFVGDRPLHMSPITLRPRVNADATTEPLTDPAELPYAIDHRQATPFAATWLLGCLKYLSERNVASVTVFETHGMAGFLLGGQDELHPRFTVENSIFPVYEALRQVRTLAPTQVVRSESSRPLAVSSWVLRGAAGDTLLLINHTPEVQTVKVGEREVDVAGYAWAKI
ncbi:hypothetical protein [Spirosoma montaniterrae]|uniref:Uncharacterized protein n=1 Tax=Spirosoma montaniterrae TaxID=1178516 RepID=A0A1P9WV83_9BACT|nr:hypothetical protein [Spirosoma montaniterrae]AQG79240.1 hypothetical protein AWR27_07825 [Spirosoma montaniterrae]